MNTRRIKICRLFDGKSKVNFMDLPNAHFLNLPKVSWETEISFVQAHLLFNTNSYLYWTVMVLGTILNDSCMRPERTWFGMIYFRIYFSL